MKKISDQKLYFLGLLILSAVLVTSVHARTENQSTRYEDSSNLRPATHAISASDWFQSFIETFSKAKIGDQENNIDRTDNQTIIFAKKKNKQEKEVQMKEKLENSVMYLQEESETNEVEGSEETGTVNEILGMNMYLHVIYVHS